MKTLACFTVLFGAAAAFSACGGNVAVDPGGTTTESGSTSTTPTTSTTITTTTPTTTTITTTITTGPCGNWQYSQDPACQSCAEQICCGTLAACAAGTSCGQLIECITLCPNSDAACFESCIMSGMAPGFVELQTLVQCIDNACASIPGCPSGGLCQTGFEAPTPACGACLSANCCGQFQACMNDLGAPGSQPCGDCILGVAANPAACETDPLYNAALACESNVCVNDCASSICDTGLTTTNPPCDACLSNACCSAFQACVNDASSPSCLDACILAGSANPDCNDPSKPLGALFLGITSCWNNSCAGPSTCGGGI